MECPLQFCTFTLGELLFGVHVRSIQEIIRHQEMTRIPTASPIVRGLINLRGQIVLAIDLRYRLGLTSRPSDSDSKSVIIRTDDRPLGLLVDEVGDILNLGNSIMEPIPEAIREGVGGFLHGIYKLPDQLLLVLDVERLADFDAVTGTAA